jgi:hypothetical protein
MARHVPYYGIFIIESMDEENEFNEKLDGKVLKQILELCGIPNHYMYLRTSLELEYAMTLFRQSDYGFLHISCHGNEKGLCLSLDDLTFEELGDIIGPYLQYRRLFLSACKAACFQFAERFIPRHHCYSVMGSPESIDYDKAAIFWSSYYYLMYRDDQQRMWQRNIIPTLSNVTRTFSESLNYFSIINEKNPVAKTSLREMHFKNGTPVFDRVQPTQFENLYWEQALAEEDLRGEALQGIITDRS